jgi:hypothetical protein
MQLGAEVRSGIIRETRGQSKGMLNGCPWNTMRGAEGGSAVSARLTNRCSALSAKPL